jgi:hypothetical protein
MGWHWLDWGCRLAFPALGAGVTPPTGPAVPALSLVRHLADCALVVTDTYHAAVLAWTFGVPCVALAAPVADAAADVNSGAAFNWRDKREVFFSQYDALDFLVRAEELGAPPRLAARVERIVTCLEDRRHAEAVTRRLRQHARAAEGDLATALRGLLGPREQAVTRVPAPV